MTKALLTLLSAALVCAHGTTYAQNANNKAAASHIKAATHNPATAAKTTATDSRLLAITTRIFDGSAYELLDSAHCTYNNPSYGFDYRTNQWKFEKALSWDYDGSIFAESYRVSQTFNSNNRIATAHYEFYDNAQWQDEEFVAYTYNANGDIATVKDAYFNGTTWDSSRTTKTYDASNRLTVSVLETFDDMSSTWTNESRETNTYNGSGQLTSSTTEYYTGNQWQNGYRITHTYVNNLRTETLSEQYMAGSWEKGGLSTYTYNANGNVTVEEFKGWYNNAWQPQSRNTHTYDANNDLATTISEQYIMSNYVNMSKTTFTNNSYHQQTRETDESWDNATNQFVAQMGNMDTRYYYEPFTNSVKDSKAAQGNISITPNPAKDMLHLRATFAEPTAADVTFTDMTGRIVRQLHMPTTAQHSTAIDISSLAPGIYTLNLNAGGTVTSRKVVVQ